ncbi:MAG: DUF4924 family protein [Muribaculaceae bacterium]|nr:DUF4924 family protein [Muribaculaceae bacterium]
MTIASQLRKENIAQYLLYMWQIEDIIRANGLDIDRINENVVSRFPEEQRKQISEWYESLIDMMRREEVQQKGHLQINRNIIGALADLNNRILADHDPKFDRYRKEFYDTLPLIVELRAKAGNDKSGEIETCFNALYGMLMLRLQKKEISPDTARAFERISKFVALLSHDFALDERDELFKNNDNKSGE